jgi:ATP-dependent RNA helicase RhlE
VCLLLRIGLAAKGNKVSFKDFNLHKQLNDAIAKVGFDEPTPIQRDAIGPILQGNDLLGLAQTGTGKTAAFVLPILNSMIGGPRRRVRALVISPTRELAEQIEQDFRSLGRFTGFQTISVFGGVSINTQIYRLRKGVEIVVACPGRLLDHLNRGTIDLSDVETVVIDEADRMFDMGFLPDIKRIFARVNRRRQTLLFSATMPQGIRSLVADVLQKPVVVEIGLRAPVNTVSHSIYPVQGGRKKDLLLEILEEELTESVIIFTRTKRGASALANRLGKAGYKATSLQGNLSQNQRKAALDSFRRGAYKILVATDIAARGLDIDNVSHVINYDFPDTPDAYTHRIGRTGRASKKGWALTLATTEDKPMLRNIERILGEKIERSRIPGYDWGKESSAPKPPRGGNRRFSSKPRVSTRNRPGRRSEQSHSSR